MLHRIESPVTCFSLKLSLLLQYKEISEAHELALREMSQSEQSVKCASEQLITQNWEEITTLTEKLKEANEQRQNLQDQLDMFQQKGKPYIYHNLKILTSFVV